MKLSAGAPIVEPNTKSKVSNGSTIFAERFYILSVGLVHQRTVSSGKGVRTACGSSEVSIVGTSLEAAE